MQLNKWCLKMSKAAFFPGVNCSFNHTKWGPWLLDPHHVVRISQSLTSPLRVRQVSMTAEQSKTVVGPWLQHLRSLRTDSSHCGTLHLMRFRSLLSCQSAGSVTASPTIFHPRPTIPESATLRCASRITLNAQLVISPFPLGEQTTTVTHFLLSQT